jgi:hypothetical protein
MMVHIQTAPLKQLFFIVAPLSIRGLVQIVWVLRGGYTRSTGGECDTPP